MRIIRTIAVAFSLYSRIPMPVFRWKEEDMKYAIACLPLVGAVIGAISYLVYYVLQKAGASDLCMVASFSAVPLLLTGGFHVDGFMDVQDALHSYKSKEEKLEILKDPHIGAFAVIAFVTYGCIWLAGLSYLAGDVRRWDMAMPFLCIGFWEARALTAVLSILCPKARQEGMLHEETKKTGTVTIVWSLIEAFLGIGIMSYFGIKATFIILPSLLLFSAYYWYKCKKEFGGVTGDTAGFYVMVSELLIILAVVASCFKG